MVFTCTLYLAICHVVCLGIAEIVPYQPTQGNYISNKHYNISNSVFLLILDDFLRMAHSPSLINMILQEVTAVS